MEEYKVKFYIDSQTKKIELIEYLDNLPDKVRLKILKYIEYLRSHRGCLDEPYSRHIMGKIRELRVDFGKDRHRVFYFIILGKRIVLLHAFPKHTAKTPQSEINKAVSNYQDVLSNLYLYE